MPKKLERRGQFQFFIYSIQHPNTFRSRSRTIYRAGFCLMYCTCSICCSLQGSLGSSENGKGGTERQFWDGAGLEGEGTGRLGDRDRRRERRKVTEKERRWVAETEGLREGETLGNGRTTGRRNGDTDGTASGPSLCPLNSTEFNLMLVLASSRSLPLIYVAISLY